MTTRENRHAFVDEAEKLTFGSLKDYVDKSTLAGRLDVSTRTLDRWHVRRIGPPRIKVGRTILYHLPSVDKWLQSKVDGT